MTFSARCVELTVTRADEGLCRASMADVVLMSAGERLAQPQNLRVVLLESSLDEGRGLLLPCFLQLCVYPRLLELGRADRLLDDLDRGIREGLAQLLDGKLRAAYAMLVEPARLQPRMHGETRVWYYRLADRDAVESVVVVDSVQVGAEDHGALGTGAEQGVAWLKTVWDGELVRAV